jgi:hypothetical protein
LIYRVHGIDGSVELLQAKNAKEARALAADLLEAPVARVQVLEASEANEPLDENPSEDEGEEDDDE